MKTKPRLVSAHLPKRLILCMMLASAPAFAQTTAETPAEVPATTPPQPPPPPPTNTRPANDDEEEIIELSPFTVTASEDQGWLAENTLAGSRLNSSLRDTPAVLDVLTSEFLEEFGVTDLADALQFSTNFEENLGDLGGAGAINASFPGANQSLNFETRGQRAALVRNFVPTGFRPEFYTIDRIDNSSGPNAILFGIGGAGGVANTSTKRAKLNRDNTILELRVDENGSFRSTVDANVVVKKDNLGVRLNLIADRAKTFREHSDNDLDGIHFTIKYRPTKTTEINLELERDQRNSLIVDPRTLREGLSTWLDAGSQVVTVPTDWTTLSTSARNTFLASNGTPFGIGAFAAGNRWVYVNEGDESFLVNQALSLQTRSPSNRPVLDERLAPFSVNLSGPGGQRETNRSLAALSIDQRLAENLFLNLSLSREYGDTRTHQTFLNGTGTGDTFLAADPNAVIANASTLFNPNNIDFATNSDGQTINAYAGQQFIEGRWRRREQNGNQNYAQLTLAWKLQAGRWGNHNLVATLGYTQAEGSGHEPDLVWNGAPFNRTVSNAANLVYVRNYITPGDYSTYHVGDWRDVLDLQWEHPTLGLITPVFAGGVVRANETSNRYGLIALQSFLFKGRLVTTLGLRRDEQTVKTFLPVNVRPEPFNNSNGFNAINEDSPISEVEDFGNTSSLGVVFHVTETISLYYNASNSFSPGNAQRYGPDGLPSPQQNGEGTDFGLKFNYGNGKFVIDIGRFETTNVNVASTSGFGASGILNQWNEIFETLNAPSNGPQLFDTSDPAQIDALRASYSDLRPVFVAVGDIFDSASSGYEVRMTANPFKGLRLRATYANTEKTNENLLKFTRVARAQLGEFIAELQTENPSVDVGSLTLGEPGDLTIGENLALLDSSIEELIDTNSNAFGSSRHRLTFNAGYDLPGKALKGWSISTGVVYRSGSVVGTYRIIDPAVPGDVIEEVQFTGSSVITWNANLRYRTRVELFGHKTQMTLQLNVANLFQSSPDILVRRFDTIVVAPGDPLPEPSNPSSVFIQAPRTISASVRLSF